MFDVNGNQLNQSTLLPLERIASRCHALAAGLLFISAGRNSNRRSTFPAASQTREYLSASEILGL
jgi:hypothetical protein